MNSVCGDGFNVGASSDQGKFVLNETCDQKYMPDCIYNYFEKDTNTYGEPQYYPCQIDAYGVCHQKFSDAKPNYKKCTNQCPSCGDLSKYDIKDNGIYNVCTKNLETCKKCLGPNDVKFTGIPGELGIGARTLTDKYSEICPKSGSYTECDSSESACITNVKTILNKIKVDLSASCSVTDIFDKIKSDGESTIKCNGTKGIQGDEMWLDNVLNVATEDYCDPTKQSEWKCNKKDEKIPTYCKNEKCVINKTTQQCGCPAGTFLLEDDTCGKAICPSGITVNGLDKRNKCKKIDGKCTYIPAGGLFPGRGHLECVKKS